VLQAEAHVDGTSLVLNSDNVLIGSVETATEVVLEADVVLAFEKVLPGVAAPTDMI
jgi:hypothetical protein